MSKGLKYDPDLAHREKHRWNNDYPAIITEDGKGVSKCPSTIDEKKAQNLLDDGIWHWGRNRGKDRPARVYNVCDGVPYRAHIMGGKYHGFPEIPSEIPPELRDTLRELAAKADKGDVFDAWLEEYKDL